MSAAMTKTGYKLAALAFVNQIRVEYGMEPLKELKQGGWSGYNCPIANSLKGGPLTHIYANKTSLRFNDPTIPTTFHGPAERVIDLPAAVSMFITTFDDLRRRYYPELRWRHT